VWFNGDENMAEKIHVMKINIIKVTPNVVVEWLKLLLLIREVPGSNLCPNTSYPDRGVSWFYSAPPDKYQDSALNQATTVSFHILSNSSFTCHPPIRHYIA
jgi:hypothetical protein